MLALPHMEDFTLKQKLGIVRCVAAALLWLLATAPGPLRAQTAVAKMNNMQNLVCHYSLNRGELSLALLSTSNKTDPRKVYKFREELEVKLEVNTEKSAIVGTSDLKVAVLGDFRASIDRQYKLFRFNIVMDESSSIENADLETARDIIERFLTKIPVSYEIQLIRFASQVQVATGFSNDLETFLSALNAPRLSGGTTFYDSFDQAIKELRLAGDDVPLRFTIAFTDGADTASTRFSSFDDFRHQVQLNTEQDQVFMFIAGIGTDGEIQHDLLKRVPGKMGLYHKLVDIPELEKLFETVANALDKTYIVRIPIVASHQGSKMVYILRRDEYGKHETIQDVPLPASCIP